MDNPIKYTIPQALREALLKISLDTDVVAEYRGIESWRLAAVSAARWLLRTAATSEDMPKQLHSVLRNVAQVAKKMSQSKDHEVRTKSGQLRLELERFLGEDDDD